MIRSCIDLGTNTCLLLIVQWDPEQQQVQQVLWDEARIVRLGQGVDQNRSFQSEAMQRTLACLKDYSQIIQRYPSQHPTVCVATSQARDAKNRDPFFEEVQQLTGLRFQVLSGEQEAQATFLGATLPDLQPMGVLDIGGGSTELMAQDRDTSMTGSSLWLKSLDIGSVRLTERFLHSDPVTDLEFWACQQAIDQQLETLVHEVPSQQQPWVAVAGTATTLASCYFQCKEFDTASIEKVLLTQGDLHRMVEELKWRSVLERKAWMGIEEGRADVILAGALIFWRVMEKLNLPCFRVSTRGLRYGALKLFTEIDELLKA